MPAHARFWHTPRASVTGTKARASRVHGATRARRYAAAAGHRGSVRETAGCDRRNRALQAARTRANELRVERRVAEDCRRPRHLVDPGPPLPRAVERVQPAHERARVRALG